MIVAAERNRTRPKDVVVWLESLQSISIPSGKRHVCMETHTPFPNTAFWGFGVCVGSTLAGLNRIDAIAEASPGLACFRACRDARANGSSNQSREQGVVGRQGVVFVLESAFFEQPYDAAGRSGHHSGDIFQLERGKREEGARGMGWASIHAIEDDAVKMWVRVKSGAKTLYRGHCTAKTSLYTMMNASAAPLIGEERTQEGTQDFAREPRVPGTAVTERVRQGEHPLAHGHFG